MTGFEGSNRGSDKKGEALYQEQGVKRAEERATRESLNKGSVAKGDASYAEGFVGYRGFGQSSFEQVSYADGAEREIDPDVERVLELESLNSLLNAAKRAAEEGRVGAEEQVKIIEEMIEKHNEAHANLAELTDLLERAKEAAASGDERSIKHVETLKQMIKRDRRKYGIDPTE